MSFKKELKGVKVEFYVETAEDPKQALVALTKAREDISTVLLKRLSMLMTGVGRWSWEVMEKQVAVKSEVSASIC